MSASISAEDLLRGEGPTLIPIGQLAKRVPGLREHVHPTTLHRWATVGLKVPGGSQILLKSRWVGAQRCSTVEWLAEFLDAVDAARNGEAPPEGAELIAKGC